MAKEVASGSELVVSCSRVARRNPRKRVVARSGGRNGLFEVVSVKREPIPTLFDRIAFFHVVPIPPPSPKLPTPTHPFPMANQLRLVLCSVRIGSSRQSERRRKGTGKSYRKIHQ